MRSHLRHLGFCTTIAAGCASLLVGTAGAVGGFLEYATDKVTLPCSASTCTFWLVLREGAADHVTMNVGDDNIYARPMWSLRLPENRYLGWYGARPLDSFCGLKEPKNIFVNTGQWRSVQCQTAFEMHLRLGDLNDTFVASSAELASPMHVFGEDGADYLRSAKGKDTLNGGNGNDVLRAGPGADTLLGEADDDILDGSDGADVLDCGGGNDTVPYQGRISALNVTLDDTANDGASGENDKIGTTCENVEAWNGADKVVGSSGSNKLYGRDGNDSLKGGGGSDRLYGGNGNDSLFGEAGNDYLNGDAGDDTIDGGSGTDTVYGGAGNDTISVKDGQKDTVYCGAGDYDLVTYDAGLDEIDIGSCERR
jgi:hypothetical protein